MITLIHLPIFTIRWRDVRCTLSSKMHHSLHLQLYVVFSFWYLFPFNLCWFWLYPVDKRSSVKHIQFGRWRVVARKDLFSYSIWLCQWWSSNSVSVNLNIYWLIMNNQREMCLKASNTLNYSLILEEYLTFGAGKHSEAMVVVCCICKGKGTWYLLLPLTCWAGFFKIILDFIYIFNFILNNIILYILFKFCLNFDIFTVFFHSMEHSDNLHSNNGNQIKKNWTQF